MARLTWDTFPKSGSAWLARTLELCYPNDEVVWGGHRSTTFISSPNCITSVRHPKETVASYLSFFQDNSVEPVVDWYCRFIDRTIKYQDRIYVSRFEDLISNPLVEIDNYASMFGLHSPVPVTHEEITDSVRATHANHLPSPRTEKREQAEILVANSPELSHAIELYELLFSLRGV